jgi:hypothetical protein
MNQYGQSIQGLPSLDQYNLQVRMSKQMQREPAGVLCPCGAEMVYSEVHPAYNVSFGNPNCLSPMQHQNVACPVCHKTGFKEPG